MLITLLEQWADQRPEQPALTNESRSWNWREYRDAVFSIAAQLSALNIRRLALAGNNSAEWAIFDLACIHSGIVCIPVPPFFSSTQQSWLLESCMADAIVGGERRSGWTRAASTLGELQIRRVEAATELPAETAKITYTSGTTGEPKGVCLSLAGMSWSAHTLAMQMRPLSLQRHMVTLPLCTLLENLCGIYIPLCLGVETIVLPPAMIGFEGSSQFNPASFAQALTRWQPQSLVLVPELIRVLYQLHLKQPVCTASLRFVAAGGGKISSSLLEQAQQLGLPVFEGYGLSECGSVVSLNLPGSNQTGSAGRLLPGISAALNNRGELVIDSPANALGYLNGSLQHGAVCSGDIAHLDEAGFVHITGRKKNVQITAFGRNFSPEWIEAEAMVCPAVRRLVIFGEGLATNVALVDAMPGMEEAARAQLHQLSQRLPDYAQLHHLLFTPTISSPAVLTPNGRPRRDAIWQLFHEQILSYSEAS